MRFSPLFRLIRAPVGWMAKICDGRRVRSRATGQVGLTCGLSCAIHEAQAAAGGRANQEGRGPMALVTIRVTAIDGSAMFAVCDTRKPLLKANAVSFFSSAEGAISHIAMIKAHRAERRKAAAARRKSAP